MQMKFTFFFMKFIKLSIYLIIKNTPSKHILYPPSISHKPQKINHRKLFKTNLPSATMHK